MKSPHSANTARFKYHLNQVIIKSLLSAANDDEWIITLIIDYESEH